MNIKTSLHIKYSWKSVLVQIMMLCMSLIITAGWVQASCIDIEDVPLDTLEQQAPGIIMFVIDDSGSMDWEFICRGETDGKFLGSIEYVFADPGDNNYGSWESNGDILEGSSDANRWKSQWAGHNRLYYDPEQYYAPWPTYENVDPNTPPSNPVNSTPTLDLGATYSDLSKITTAAILDAGGVIVDNSDTNTSEGEIIVDDTDTGFSYIPSSGWSYWDNNDGYYNDNYQNISLQDQYDGVTAQWLFNIVDAGEYEVLASLSTNNNRTSSVDYTVDHAGGSTIVNKSQDNGSLAQKWESLGIYNFNTGAGAGKVTMECAGGIAKYVAVDAIKLVPQFEVAQPDRLFEAGNGWSSSSSGEGFNGEYLYTNAGSQTYTATWTAASLDTAETYNVYAWWAGQNSNRLPDVHYRTYDSATQLADTSVDQYNDRGQWNLIAENVSFSTGTGIVEINQYAGTSGMCADAVAFMPSTAAEPVNIVRAHYYVESGGNTYLVNLNNAFQYYLVDDQNGNDNIDYKSELVSLTTSEAEAAGIVTGRSYTEERQNFANWYSFYRKRELTAKNAIACVIQDTPGVYIGLHCINSGMQSYARPVQVMLNEVLHDESETLFTALFNINSDYSTPLRNGLHNIGRYFQGDYEKPSPLPSDNFSSETYPYFTADKGGTCQQSFAIVMTDGYWNGYYDPPVGNADKDDDGTQIDGFDGFPFADDASYTLADVAMYYYEHDLNTNLNNDVPISTEDTIDLADHQHLVTYTLSFGVDGTIEQSTYPECVSGGVCPDPWPNPFDSNAKKIDDMFHAAVNGRGKYMNAASPQEMVDAMNELKNDIISRLGAASSLATNSIQRTVGTVVYQGTYNTGGWFGEVRALPVNVQSGTLGSPLWLASEHVPEWNARTIISYDGTSSIIFNYNNLSSEQKTLLANNGDNVENLVNFIRGDKSNDTSHDGGTFRVRSNPIGDIVHSAPFHYKDVIYIGANDGMLHAIDAGTGQEIFCYVPAIVYDHLSSLAIPAYSHKYYVDSTPTVTSVNGKDILVCGLGKGGKGYFGLNVTSPDEPAALWEYTGDDDLGYSFSDANIVKTSDGKMVVFGNGYDSVSQTAALFLLNPETGELVKKLDTLTTGCNGLSTPRVVDVDADGVADFAFAGDLQGNLWKFDLRGSSDNWKVYFSDGTPKPLVTARNASGEIQPITSRPDVMLDCARGNFSKLGNGLMVVFGTGQYLNPDDFDDFTTQSFYGIWDWSDIWENAESYEIAKAKFLGEMASDRSLSNISGTTLQQQTVELESGDYLILSDNPVEWYNPDTQDGSHMGWFFDLPTAGERGIRDARLKMGIAEVVSVTPSSSPCEAGGSSVVYRLNACTGGRTDFTTFDLDGDGVDKDDLIDDFPPTGKKFDRAALMEGIDVGPDTTYYPDALGGVNPVAGPEILEGMEYWRVIQ